MSYTNEFLTGLNESLSENREKGKYHWIEVGRASKRVDTYDPLKFGEEGYPGDAPTLGRVVLMQFTNMVRHGDSLPTGIGWLNPGWDPEVASQMEFDLGLGLGPEPEDPRYLAFRATRDHVHDAAEFVGYPPGVNAPSTAEGAMRATETAGRLVIPEPRLAVAGHLIRSM